MKTLITTAALALAVLAASPLSAATLTATTAGGNGSFTIFYTDTNGNGLFDLKELTSFSGFTDVFGAHDIVLLAVPKIAGIARAGALAGASLYSKSWWNFETAGNVDLNWDTAASKNNWTYKINPSQVPLPAGLPVLLAGLAGLALLARRRSKAL